MSEKDKFILKNDNGEEQVFYKLITFKSNITNKKYLVYCDDAKRIYGSIILKDDSNNINLEKITEDIDLGEVNKAISKVKNELEGI